MVKMETEPVFHGAVLGVVLAETRIPSLYSGAYTSDDYYYYA
jgi:hypothetical protein